MKALISTPKMVWVAITIFIVIAIAFIVFLLGYKVETTLNATVKTNGATKSLYVTSDVAYKINNLNNINISMGDKTYTTQISRITFDKDLRMYKLDLTNLSINLLPQSTLKATIVTGSQSIGSFLFGGV